LKNPWKTGVDQGGTYRVTTWAGRNEFEEMRMDLGNSPSEGIGKEIYKGLAPRKALWE